MKKFVEKDVAENPLYHDTWKLLKKYRDVVWSLEISVQHVRSKFEIEYGTSIEEFLDSIYLAGADLNGSDIEHHAKCIERSHKMLKLLDSAVELLRTRHKNGEAYYWLLYYSFLSPQQLKNVEEIIENLRPHIRDISFRTYYRRRREAIDALSSVLWGYTSKDSLDNASMAEELLRQKMGNSPEAIAALEAYQLAAGECSSIVAEQAFESGFQTAVQMLVAGLIPPENKFAAEVPLTTQELRKMDGEQVFCLDMNEEVRVVARKKGFIQVTNDKEIHLITGLTLYRHRPSWCQ